MWRPDQATAQPASIQAVPKDDERLKIMDPGGSLIAELEGAIQSGSKEKRIDALRRVTDLFVADADRLNDQQIDVFDDVLGHLIKRIEGRALAELSQRLGPVKKAPLEVVRRLARDDDIAVAEPVLTRSGRLSDRDLVEIANTKSQGHLLAIAGRLEVAPVVTDVLLRRGDQQVFHKLAENSGASFSNIGYATLVRLSEHDEGLAEKVGLRLDIPIRLFRELLFRATEAVRSRLLAMAGPESREKIRSVLAIISEDAQREAGVHSERDYAAAHARILEMKNAGRLDERVFFEFAKADRYADMVAALAVLCGAPIPLIESLLQSEHREAWLIPCKAAGFDWSTVRAILACRSFAHALSSQTLEAARADYFGFSQTSASRVLRFWQVRQSASKDATPAGAAPESNMMESQSSRAG